MTSLPRPHPAFLEKKSRILEQLATPDSDYTDASPKGSVDEAIRDLIGDINGADGFVTTSSCAGRVSIFLEGRRQQPPQREVGLTEHGLEEIPETIGTSTEDGGVGQDGARDKAYGQVAGVGGKGAGGKWLYVSHDPVPYDDDIYVRGMQVLGLRVGDGNDLGDDGEDTRFIHFKFEPMILHVLTASPQHAQLLLQAAMQAGFRESGALNLLAAGGGAGSSVATPMVAVRSMGLGLEALVGQQTADGRAALVAPAHLRTLLRLANERFGENVRRKERFRCAFQDRLAAVAGAVEGRKGREWEDPVARRERKRAEGVARKMEVQGKLGRGGEEQGLDGEGDGGLDLMFG